MSEFINDKPKKKPTTKLSTHHTGQWLPLAKEMGGGSLHVFFTHFGLFELSYRHL